ncbi:MAG TPA: hypothetical protein VK507_18475, partial [Iamia sp.]|nr:hypothetical protein [Iamia sp.]
MSASEDAGEADEPTGGATPGRMLIRLSWAGTVITCVTSVVNAATGDRDHYALSAAPALVLLALGSVAFLWAFAIAVERSRTEEIGVGGLFFLEGCAPRRVQMAMMASVAVQTVVPLGVAFVRPFTAFAVLAPVWSLGLAGLWGARHGTFPPRRRPGAADGPDSG